MFETVLTRAQWAPLEAAHQSRVDVHTTGHLARRQAGQAHPVEDFLFTYYPYSVAKLRRWHPGFGVALADALDDERASWRFYRPVGDGLLTLDVDAFLAARGSTVTFVRDLLARTVSRSAQLGCFGLHEWAMVYRQDPGEVRHDSYPLRLGPTGTDAVVENHQLRCTHIDAFRFFTPAAMPRNAIAPTRQSQPALEQPGCLHAGMDLYKWCTKLAPAISAELTLACFELAKEIRVLDMRASPYDLSSLGYDPVPIETPAGKAAYAAAQRGFSIRSNALRQSLIDALDALAVL